MEGKSLDDIWRFQEEDIEKFHERLETYYEREEQAQEDFNELIRPPGEKPAKT